MNAEQMAAHKANLMAMAAAYDKKVAAFGFTITDVTPAGFGPTESNDSYSTDAPQLTTEQQSLKRTISEAETILRGKIAGSRRMKVLESLSNAKERLAAL